MKRTRLFKLNRLQRFLMIEFDEIIKVIYYPLAFLSLLGLLCIYKKYVIILLALFMLSWRGFALYSSSRYYCIIIIYATGLTLYFFKNHLRKNRCIILAAVALIVSINIIRSFSASQNNYINDLKAFVERKESTEDNYDIYVYEKEKVRIPTQTMIYADLFPFTADTLDKGLTYFYLENSFFSKTLYIIAQRNMLNQADSDAKDHNKYYVTKKTVGNFFTGSYQKRIQICKIFPFTPFPPQEVLTAINNAELKAYITEYDAFIYQKDNCLIWAIGDKLNVGTEIIYHLITDYPEYLPPSRIKYGFDNRGIRVNNKDVLNISGYDIYKKEIPTEYPIKKIRCGFNDNGEKVWAREFYVYLD